MIYSGSSGRIRTYNPSVNSRNNSYNQITSRKESSGLDTRSDSELEKNNREVSSRECSTSLLRENAGFWTGSGPENIGRTQTLEWLNARIDQLEAELAEERELHACALRAWLDSESRLEAAGAK